MKSWHLILLGLFIGMISSAALFLVTAPPRGTSVELLPAPTPAPIVVQVDGAVQNPGVYNLPRDSRVEQAIQAAGGLAAEANPAAVNLAAPLRDGDKLVVPVVGTPVAPPQAASGSTAPQEKSASITSSSGSSDSADAPAAPAASTGLINLNTATLEELDSLPGIGATRAQQIIDYRNAHGGFKTVDELDNVSGIGPATLEKLKPYITVN